MSDIVHHDTGAEDTAAVQIPAPVLPPAVQPLPPILFTVGRGRTSAVGRRVTVDTSNGVVDGLIRAIEGQPGEQETWIAFGTFKNDHRSEADFEAACAVGIDVDYFNDAGAHASIAEPAAAKFTRAWNAERPPGNAFHWTPRGFRLIFASAEAIEDRSRLAAYKASAANDVDAWLHRHALAASPDGKRKRGGFSVDRPTLDVARMFWHPRAMVDGVQRNEGVALLRSEPVAPPNEPDPTPPPSAVTISAGETTVADAVAAFNKDHPGNWPRSGGECPACRHHGCFGTLSDDPSRWACFSASHEADSAGCGIRGASCFHGDALDLAAASAGLSREALLREEGYLVADHHGDAEPSRRGSVSRKIVDLVVGTGIELWHTPDNVAYADIRRGRGRESLRVGSRAFGHYVRKIYFDAFEGAPPSQPLAEAIATLEAKAIHGGAEREVFLRVAAVEDEVYIDLANESGEVVEVLPGSWSIVVDPPVRFRRTARMRPLPRPVSGRPLEQLRAFLHASGDDDFYLCVVWLVAALSGRGPFVVLIVQGEQGSGKSTRTRVLVRLVDPTQAELRSPPRDERDAAISATNRYVLACDNLSVTKEWFADEVCRIATGAGFSTRKLYEDEDEVVFEVKRPVILNGIPDLATRPDLADRAIVCRLAAIEEDKRATEKAFWDAFDEARPALLGSLLDVLAASLAALPTVAAEGLPRMADFARLGLAVEKVLGWPQGAFLRAYSMNQRASFEGQLSSDPVVAVLLDLLNNMPGWEGTSTSLYDELSAHAPPTALRSQTWPRSARGLHDHLQRLAPALRSVGVHVTFERSANRRVVRVEKDPDAGGSPKPAPAAPFPMPPLPEAATADPAPLTQ